MLALGEFGISDLAALSDVQESTLRTILRRESHYVEEIGHMPTGRRGGQPKRWRLRAEAREHLRMQLQELEREGAGPWLGERTGASDTLPAGIIAAQDVLLRLAPATADPVERAGLIKLARAHMDAADASAPVVPAAARADGQHVALRRRILDLLLQLEEIEQSSDQRGPSRAGEVLIDLLLAVGKADHEPLTSATRNRLALSPFPLFAGQARGSSPDQQPDADRSEAAQEAAASEAPAPAGGRQRKWLPARSARSSPPAEAHPQARERDRPSDRHPNCPHRPQCPDANSPDREAAQAIVSHPEQGWSLLCNGIVIFEDAGELLPGAAIRPGSQTQQEEQLVEEWFSRRSRSAS